MAVETVTIFRDDIDGTPAEGTVRFSLDGTDYEIELNGKHNTRLRETLGKYIAAARKSGGRSAPRKVRPKGKPAVARVPDGSSPDTPSNDEVRAWAKERGYMVKDRGRIPGDVIRDYLAAH